MKRNILLILFLGLVSVVSAQNPQDVYAHTLEDVLYKIEKQYQIKLQYEKKILKGQTVSFADWKMFSDPETTLSNILAPLELRYIKKSDSIYEIKKWEYFRKPVEEGQKHLDLLWKSYPSLELWQERRCLLRNNMLKKMGLFPLPIRNSLNPIKSNYRKYDGYSAENYALEIVPGVYLCGTLYRPLKAKLNTPAMLCPHGHFYNKVDKSIPNERGRYREDQQKRCATLARMGVIVFSYDMFAWGEYNFQVPLKDHRSGLALTMQTWGSMRVVDFLTSMKEVDKNRIGITAASGGGTQSFLAAALDDRIKLCVPVVMVSSYFFGGCPCESGLPIHQFDNEIQSNNAEIAALCAPRPLLVISDGHDWTANVPNIEFPYLQKIYGLYGRTDDVENIHLKNENHDYGFSKRKAMYDFVARHFDLDVKKVQNKDGNFDESRVTVEPAVEMYVFREKQSYPANAVQGSDLVRKALQKQIQ
ncbi:alpha/beta hydrolase family protein [Coprobacter sp.]